MRICLDFDGVLHDASNPIEGRRMGPPMSGALDGVEALLAAGHTLSVCTANHLGGAPDGTDNHITRWLYYWGFPSIDVFNAKPMADLYIDDKGYAFHGWNVVLHDLTPRRREPTVRELVAMPAKELHAIVREAEREQYEHEHGGEG